MPAGLRGRVNFRKGMIMSDMIDREALLRQIDIDSDGEPGYYGDTWKFIDTIKSMPSALSTNLAEVGTDCISRQQAIDIAKDLTITVEGYEMHNQAVMNYCADIMQLPPIQPDIVRCKDCKHWIPYDWMFSEAWQSKNIADYPEDEIGCDCCDMAMKANDFCSRGEKREVTNA